MAKKSHKKRSTKTNRLNQPCCERILVFLTALFVFSMPLFIWPGAITEYGYGKSIFALVGVSVLVILWGIHALVKGKWEIRLPWITFPVLGLVLVSLFSLIRATNGRVVIQSLILVIFFFLFFLVIANLVREKRDVNLILYSLLLSAFFASLYGLLQYLGVMRGTSGGHGLGEVISTMGNRNYLGGFLAYLLFPSVILIVRLRSRILRALAILLLSFNFGMVMLVQQTGTRLGLSVAAVVLLLGWAIFRPIEPIRNNRAWLVALLFFLIFTFLVEAPSGPLNSVVGLSADGRSWLGRVWDRNVDKVRTWDWWIGWEMFKDHPLVGVGLGNYKLNFIPYKAQFLATPRGEAYDFYITRAAQAHNEYVQATAELGSLGILALLAVFLAIPFSFWIRLRRNPNEGDRFDLLLLACGVVTFLVHAIASFPAHLPASSLVLVVTLGLASAPVYGEAAMKTVRIKGWPLRALVGVATAFCLVTSVTAIRDVSANILFGEGERQLEQGYVYTSRETFLRSAALDFCPRQVYYYLAIVNLKQGHDEEAMANLTKCLTRFVTENTCLNLANLAVNLNDVETARECVELLVASHPQPTTQLQARYLQGVIAIRDGEYDLAISMLEDLTLAHPSFEPPYIALGDLYRGQGRSVHAYDSYEKALNLVEAKLTSAEGKLARATSYLEEYELRSEIDLLAQEKEAIQAGLAKLPRP